MKIESILNENELDAIYVSDLNNIRYLCGFTGTTALLLVSKDTMFLYVDSRYFQQAQQQTKNINVVLTTRGDARNELRTSIKENNFKRIGFEQDYVTYQDYQKLSLIGFLFH